MPVWIHNVFFFAFIFLILLYYRILVHQLDFNVFWWSMRVTFEVIIALWIIHASVLFRITIVVCRSIKWNWLWNSPSSCTAWRSCSYGSPEFVHWCQCQGSNSEGNSYCTSWCHGIGSHINGFSEKICFGLQ